MPQSSSSLPRACMGRRLRKCGSCGFNGFAVNGHRSFARKGMDSPPSRKLSRPVCAMTYALAIAVRKFGLSPGTQVRRPATKAPCGCGIPAVFPAQAPRRTGKPIPEGGGVHSRAVDNRCARKGDRLRAQPTTSHRTARSERQHQPVVKR